MLSDVHITSSETVETDRWSHCQTPLTSFDQLREILVYWLFAT